MTTAGFGTWTSPISSKLTTESGVTLTQVYTDSDLQFSNKVFWNEIHSDEGGRYVICSTSDAGKLVEWTPAGFNARTTVHEYGGGDFIVHQGVVYFSNFSDQALYRQTSPSAKPEPITDTAQSMRYADGAASTKTSKLYFVREDHEVIKTGAKEAQNSVVAIDPVTKTQTVLVKGADFYGSPRVSPDGKRLAWVQWNHPNMPWDSTEIWTAELNDSGDQVVPGSAVKVCGGKDSQGQDISVVLPGWTSDGDLLYIGDQTNWWNMYHVTNGSHRNLHPVDAEIGGPQWQFGKTSYALDPNGGSRLATTFKSDLGLLELSSGAYKQIETGFSSHSHVCWTAEGHVYVIASSPTKFPQVIQVDVDTGKVVVLRESMSTTVDSGYFSVPQKITWPTSHEEMCHGLLYNPRNKDFYGNPSELPPVLVRAHGGPTSAFASGLDLKIQYFTSRGFAVLCVDYRGSTGYGKTYRHRLRGQWGVFDIDDCRTGVEHLIKERLADPRRVTIDGRSAGGYTTLACLVFTDVFSAGVSHFGVSDLEALMKDTHKFESRYLDTLLAPLEQGGREICRKRSPIHFVDKISCAVGLFQGDEDKVVPPNQAQMIYDAVKAKGIPTMFVLFKGEQHGFRKAENIQKSLDGEFYFFGKVLGFEPADQGIEVPIDNLKL